MTASEKHTNYLAKAITLKGTQYSAFRSVRLTVLLVIKKMSQKFNEVTTVHANFSVMQN